MITFIAVMFLGSLVYLAGTIVYHNYNDPDNYV